jgi:cation diffusion facilitator CzcD-associated flavoprotein CzcO
MYSVIIVGTGFGGLSAAINLRKKGIDDFLMLERRAFAGGTWLQNSYPGAAVDVQSPLYSLSGHPYPWSHLFAKQNEIAKYTQGIIKQYSLSKNIKLNAMVEKAQWNDDHWHILLSDGKTYDCKILLNATGPLSTPVVPKFIGLESFKGKHFHSNDWQHNVNLTNKKVAIVGSGASAVQIIPAIIDKVKCLHVVQRTPHWVIPRPDWTIPFFLRKFLATRPINTLIRWVIYWILELRVIGFKYSKTILGLVAQRPALNHLKKQISSLELREQLTPNFIIGCKRILISNTYYPALQKNNCVLHDKFDNIKHFTANGIEFAQAGEVNLDVVIFATGYNAIDSMVSYEVIGKHGIMLSKYWKDYPRAYLGTSIPNFPNYYVVTGPNTGIGHTSAIFVIESQMKYIMQCVEKIISGNAMSIEPTEFAEEKYTEMVHKEMTKTVWAYGGCTSWYQNKQGKVIAMFPGFSFTFRRLCKKFKFKHHLITR